MTQLRLLDPFQHLDEVRGLCLELQNSAPHSFFNSWGWVETWLRRIPRHVPLQFAVFLKDDSPCAAFFYTRRKIKQARILRKECVFFNETGDEVLDDLTIEYNAALGAASKLAVNTLFSAAEFSGAEEFRFSALTAPAFADLLLPESAFATEVRQFPSFYVDLDGIRQSGKSYMDCLSKNRRNQLRRSLREYERTGDLSLHSAGNVTEALEMLEALKSLHQQEWNRRGQAGAFGSEFFCNFHRTLVESRFDHGEIELLKISCGQSVIGYLYNFVYQGATLYYQSGLNYGESNVERPGLICHYLAINHSLACNRNVYNFLGGDSAYKKSLSTNSDTLYSVRVVRRNLKWQVERGLRVLTGSSA